ncbi:MAG: hypothetical protein A3J47_00190 [Candidatus Yanofskybacteria bacterium RIFCSPHIGHO2_02_FULL_43_22]|uniref:Replication protein A C-terminal domain-containing protein n=1 Tax=Candidatus Yanofskybacteria bacterium RIFCSPHIGHO2_02_FULL_43_22 TaxID=1802681 RepID=A0A1F8FQY4_9BACT|nr:MAG: hypothetical protein A3J47_00190 [Candidatus Yanofskybacteria bacterium RIFCSPHIGHO2_02_FULL_43_22]
MTQDTEQKILSIIEKLLEEYEMCPDGTRELEMPFYSLKQHCGLEYHQVINVLKKLQHEGIIEGFEHYSDYI